MMWANLHVYLLEIKLSVEAGKWDEMWTLYTLSVCHTQTLHTCLYFDSVQFGSKLIIDCKHMAILYLLGLWLLGENSLCGFPTGQRLQRSHQLPLRNICLLLDLL